MLMQQNLEKLIQLGLHGMVAEYQRQQELPEVQSLSFDEREGMLIDAETQYRAQKRLTRDLKAAKLKIPTACVEDIDYRKSRGLDRSYMQSLYSCDWIAAIQHIVITGHTGCGKSYIACALAQQAIRLGHKALFYRFPRLLEDMATARLDGSLPKLRMRLSKFKVLVLDDFALSPLTPNGLQDLLEIIDDRTGTGSLIITSQLPLNKWHEYLGEPTYADAIMDRIIHRAHKLELQGDSMRKVYGLKTEGKSC